MYSCYFRWLHIIEILWCVLHTHTKLMVMLHFLSLGALTREPRWQSAKCWLSCAVASENSFSVACQHRHVFFMKFDVNDWCDMSFFYCNVIVNHIQFRGESGITWLWTIHTTKETFKWLAVTTFVYLNMRHVIVKSRRVYVWFHITYTRNSSILYVVRRHVMIFMNAIHLV